LISAPDYEVATIGQGRHYSPSKSVSDIKYVYVCLDIDDFEKRKIAQHRINAFVQDIGHDWHIVGDRIKLSPGGYDGKDFMIIIEYKEPIEQD
jgi:hypothetical protein